MNYSIYFYRNSRAYAILAGLWCDKEKPSDSFMQGYLSNIFEEIRELYADGNTFFTIIFFNFQNENYMCSSCLTSDNMYSAWGRYGK